jgi:hypothetical protein
MKVKSKFIFTIEHPHFKSLGVLFFEYENFDNMLEAICLAKSENFKIIIFTKEYMDVSDIKILEDLNKDYNEIKFK